MDHAIGTRQNLYKGAKILDRADHAFVNLANFGHGRHLLNMFDQGLALFGAG